MGCRLIWTPLALCIAAVPAGCANLATTPVEMASKTRADEQIAISAELAYTTATTLGTALAKAGVIDKDKFKALDNDAYSALQAVRDTYKAGNATNLQEAVARLQAAVIGINCLVENSREP